MFYEEIRTKQYFSYISVCSINILYNRKSILMVTPLGTNAVVVTRIHCTEEDVQEVLQSQNIQPPKYIKSRSKTNIKDST